jgi:hypothetical protein
MFWMAALQNGRYWPTVPCREQPHANLLENDPGSLTMLCKHISNSWKMTI